jgi:chemotaxis protein CheD
MSHARAALAGLAPPSPPRPLRGFENLSRYWDHQQQSWVAPIVAGSYCVTNGDEILSTVLGSCVSTCIRDPIAGVGGINHFMLPRDEGDDDASTAMRYGAYAVERLINDLVKHDGRRERLEVKVFGGGNVIDSRAKIGEQNVAWVRRYLRDEGLAITAEDVGGGWARRLRYHGLTGRAQVKRLETSETRRVAAEERNWRASLLQHPQTTGEVELF